MTERGLSLIKAEKPGIQSAALPESLREGIEQVKVNLAALYATMAEVLQPGIDFDRVPGTDKPTLLQPGAQVLGQVFKLAQRYHIERAEKDLDREPAFIGYQVRCEIYSKESGVFLGEGVGAANSLESRHRWRYEGEGDNRRKVENSDVMSLDNTLLKMAKKRALVDATLNVTGASRLFTQDVEDLGLQEIEPASSKQVNFVRALGKKRGMTDEDLLAMASRVSGRELRSLDELSRPEASALIDQMNEGSPEPEKGKSGRKGKEPESAGGAKAEEQAALRPQDQEPPKAGELESEFAVTRSGQRVPVAGKGDSANVVAKCLRKAGPLVAGKTYTIWARPGTAEADEVGALGEGEVFRARVEIQKGVPIVVEIARDASDAPAFEETA